MKNIKMISNGKTTICFKQPKRKGSGKLNREISKAKHSIMKEMEIAIGMCPENFGEYLISKCKTRFEKACMMSVINTGSFQVNWFGEVERFFLPTHVEAISNLSDMFTILNHIKNGTHIFLSSEAFDSEEAWEIFMEVEE